jgi:hypothetical protein
MYTPGGNVTLVRWFSSAIVKRAVQHSQKLANKTFFPIGETGKCFALVPFHFMFYLKRIMKRPSIL